MNEGVFSNAFARHEAILNATKAILPEIERAGEMIMTAVHGGKTLFVCGNGGSAADSAHFAAEFTCRYKKDRRPFAAIVLGANYSHLTAVGNDYSFEAIFARELEALGRVGDILVAFTTSGVSKNILAVIEVARAKQMNVVVMTGERGKQLDSKADVVIAVPSDETARIQEMHELIYHAWCENLDKKI
jgi:D-sedoheptulose 7-phosphate isomerase